MKASLIATWLLELQSHLKGFDKTVRIVQACAVRSSDLLGQVKELMISVEPDQM